MERLFSYSDEHMLRYQMFISQKVYIYFKFDVLYSVTVCIFSQYMFSNFDLVHKNGNIIKTTSVSSHHFITSVEDKYKSV